MRMFLDIVGQTLRTLWAHKLRSFLTMFGIAWGVGSLLLLVGLGEGFRSGQKKQLASIGQDIMFLFPGRAPAVAGSQQSSRSYYLTYEDYEAIRDEARLVRNISPVLTRGDVKAISEWSSTGGQTIGVLPIFSEIRFLPIAEGRWLNNADEAQRRAVCVLGAEMAKNLFPGRPALNSVITLNGVRFTVVGIIDNIGKNENNSTNARLYLPYSTMSVLFPRTDVEVPEAISFINYQPRTRDEHDAAKEEVHKIIGRRHGFDWRDKDAFDEWDTIQSQQTVGRIFDAMNYFLGSVGLVTLALGAIGIINIMLVAVTERTKEIGLRKALGATNRSILAQFFLEGIFLTVFSGGIGMAGAAGLMALLGMLPAPPGFDPPKLVPASAVLAIASLSIAGISAGLYPARKAAMLQPVEALRKEG